MVGKEVRKVQKPIGTSVENMVRIPNEMGFVPGDVVIFEKIDEKTVKMIKIA